MQGKCKSLRLKTAGLGAFWLTAAAMLPLPTLAAPMFSDLYVFGDSLSDTGNTEIVAPGGDIPGTIFTYGDNGRFSNGPVWAEYLSADLGLGAVEPSRGGGQNYAHGGAAIDAATGQNAGLLSQYQSFLGDRGNQGADPNALYAVWAGANDLRDKIGPDSDPVAVIGESMAGYRSVLSGLIERGAEQLLVPNVPNLGRTPEAELLGISEQATQLSLLWNSFLDEMLGGLQQETEATIYAYDTFGVVEQLFADPAAFGFSNTDEPCSVLQGPLEVSCDNPDGYIFWDILHPTSAAHEVIAGGAYQLLANQQSVDVPLPATLWLLMPGLGMLMLRQRRRALGNDGTV